MKNLPQKCCANIAENGATFKGCDKQAAHWYRHHEDICSFCEEHNYACGEKITKEKEEAKRIVLNILRSPLCLMSIPTREEALGLSRQWKITAEELIEVAINKARNV